MALIDRLPLPRRGLLGRDRATAELRERLAASPTSEAINPVEAAAIAVGAGSAQQIDTSAASKIQRKQKAAHRAEGRYRDSVASVDAFRGGEQAQTMLAYEQARIEHVRKVAGERVDGEQSPIARWVAGCAEIVFVLAELTFYYTMFTYSVAPDASMGTKLAHVVVAVMIPVGTLLVERGVAGAVHKCRAPQYHGGNRIGAWAWLALATAGYVGASAAIWVLVSWRIASESLVPGLGSPPPAPIAAFFIFLFSMIIFIRAWLIHPSEHTTARARRQARITRLRDARLRRTEIRRLTRWQNTYLELAMLVAKCDNDTDQAVLSASTLVQLNRGTPAALESHGLAPLPYLASTTASAPTSPKQLDIAQLVLPLRVRSIAAAYLRTHQPPDHPTHQGLGDHIRAAVEAAPSGARA